jgi:hypothetical protein
MVDRLQLLAAVNMPPTPSTKGVAQRLAVSEEEAEAALHHAEGSELVTGRQPANGASRPAAARRMWRLSEAGRAEMYRLLDTN